MISLCLVLMCCLLCKKLVLKLLAVTARQPHGRPEFGFLHGHISEAMRRTLC